jgi:hypothetical protein
VEKARCTTTNEEKINVIQLNYSSIEKNEIMSFAQNGWKWR